MMRDPFKRKREAMVSLQLRERGIADKAVLHAFNTVPRHLFVPEDQQALSYEDHPLPIGNGQTISQPYIVALMTELLQLKPEDKVLEIGCGSGYQTAILAVLAEEIFALERHSELCLSAQEVLDSLGYNNVFMRCGDGSLGLPEHAPYDAIVAAAAAPVTPKPLIQQLAVGGRLVLPVGSSGHQVLKRYRRTQGGLIEEDHGGCRFVKFIGEHAWPEE